MQEQLYNIFVFVFASHHIGIPSIIISCIQLDPFGMVQEQFDNIFVSSFLMTRWITLFDVKLYLEEWKLLLATLE